MNSSLATRAAPCTGARGEGAVRSCVCLGAARMHPCASFPSVRVYGDAARPVPVRGGDGQAEYVHGGVGEGGGEGGEEGDRWRQKGMGKGGEHVGTTFCSPVPYVLWPELPLVFSLTYFSVALPMVRSELMQGCSIFPATSVPEELDPRRAVGLLFMQPRHPPTSPQWNCSVGGASGFSEYSGWSQMLRRAPARARNP